jgi:aminopeptidase S
MMTAQRASTGLAGTLFLLALTACSSPAINSFTITASPTALRLGPGGTTTMSVVATGSGTTPVTAAVIVYNLPEGVTTTPANPTVTTGSSTLITLTAAPNAAAGASTQVQVSAYAGLSSSNSMVTVNVVPPG